MVVEGSWRGGGEEEERVGDVVRGMKVMAFFLGDCVAGGLLVFGSGRGASVFSQSRPAWRECRLES